MNVYQELIRELLQYKDQGNDIGNAIKYCSSYAFELTELYNQGDTIQYLVNRCLENK